MGANSNIEWTDHTFNPWIGCQKVSPACTNCYAEVDSPARISRRIGLELWGPASAGAKRRVTTADYWDKLRVWNKKAGEAGRPARVFCASQADIFEDYREEMVDHKGNPYGETMDLVRARFFIEVERHQNLRFLLLTKRPENVMRMVPERWRACFPGNVWMGTTIEDQKYLKRMDDLQDIPASVRFLSCEPLLGPIHLPTSAGLFIHWVIVGGESGPNARPTAYEWFTGLREQCSHQSIPFFFKQWGEWAPTSQIDDVKTPVVELCQLPSLAVGGDIHFRIGKKLAGRLLNGQLWDQLPVRYQRELGVTA